MGTVPRSDELKCLTEAIVACIVASPLLSLVQWARIRATSIFEEGIHSDNASKREVNQSVVDDSTNSW